MADLDEFPFKNRWPSFPIFLLWKAIRVGMQPGVLDFEVTLNTWRNVMFIRIYHITYFFVLLQLFGAIN